MSRVIELPVQFSPVQLAGLKKLLDHRQESGAVIQFDSVTLDGIDGAVVQFLLSVSKTQAVAAPQELHLR